MKLFRSGGTAKQKRDRTTQGDVAVRGSSPQSASPMNLVDDDPSDQVAVDLFAGNWASRLPIEGVRSGPGELFNDERIAWLLDGVSPLAGMDVLELGPLEGGHTGMLLARGAAHVLGVEANADAFLRCLLVKNLLGLDGARFLLGNFERYLARRARRFDLVLASGVLYHLADPLKTLQDIVATSDRVAIWSHFYDRERIEEAYTHIQPFTGRTWTRTLGDDSLTYHEHSYGPGTDEKAFRGGVRPASSWVPREEVVAFFERHGYRVTLGCVQENTPAGPAACILAVR